MSFAWWFTLEREPADVAHESGEGQALGEHAEAMDALALGLELTPLGEFVNLSDEGLASLLGDEFTEELRETIPPESWFPAGDGLATVRGMLGALEQDPDAAVAFAAVVADLKQAERRLEQAEALGVRFQIVPEFGPG